MKHTPVHVSQSSEASLDRGGQRKRGRPRIFRDMSQKKEDARLRKQRQRQREREAGYATIEIRIPKDLLAAVAYTAALGISTPQSLAAFLVKGALAPYRRELESLATRAAIVWKKAAPMLKYASYLEKPGAVFRIADRQYRHEDWKPVVDELSTIRIALSRYGWTQARVERFIRRAGQRGNATASE